MSYSITFYLFVLLVVGAFASECRISNAPPCAEFVGDIFGPVRVGDFFQIAGQTSPDQRWLMISLKYSQYEIPLSLSIRLLDAFAAKNTINKTGLAEERRFNFNESTPPTSWLLPGNKFVIGILVDETKFYISIDGREYTTIRNGMSLDYIKTVVVGEVRRVDQIDHRTSFPKTRPLNAGQLTRGIYFTNDIPHQFRTDHKIIMHAIPRGNSSGWFGVEFQENGSDKPLFVYNPRFDTRTIVRNGMKDDNTWGAEETDGEFPFVVDVPFKLTFDTLSDKIKFTVNDQERFQGTFRIRQYNFHQVAGGLKLRDYGNNLKLEVTRIDHIPAAK